MEAIFKGEGDYGIEKDGRPKSDDPKKSDADKNVTIPVLQLDNLQKTNQIVDGPLQPDDMTQKVSENRNSSHYGASNTVNDTVP